MKCLDACQNAVFEFFMEFNGKAVPLYRAAEAVDGHNAVDVCNACEVLERLGLLKNVGTNTKQLVISSPCMGDIAKGYFNQGDNTSIELLKLQKQILEMEADQAAAAAAAEVARASGKGQGKLVDRRSLKKKA